jgi:hypothetical protein
MKRILPLLLILSLVASTSHSQTTAKDWTKYDCDGNLHHLFDELDSGNVIILEFVMQCGSCLLASQYLDTINNNYAISHPGKVKFYMMDYDVSFTCDTMLSWKGNVSCTMFMDGSHDVGYYGTFGMPTIVILGGSDHHVFYKGIGFNPALDVQYITDAIDQALIAAGVNDRENVPGLSTYPNPASDYSVINFPLKTSSEVTIQVFNQKGKLVSSIPLGKKSSGLNKYSLNTSALPEGIYHLHIFTDTSSLSTSIVVAR